MSHLIYRTGESASFKDGEVWTAYGDKDEVSPSRFGLEVRPFESCPYDHTFTPEERAVPLSDIWTEQEVVYEPHVLNLASVPASAFTGEHIIWVVEWYDGTYMAMTNHRVAAAKVRGDAMLWVRVSARKLAPVVS